MARAEDLAFAPTKWSVVANATNAAATATKAAPGAGFRHYITGITVSASAAIVATVEATITNAGVTIEALELPAATIAPIMFNYMRPIECDINGAAVLSCPALGAGVKGSVTLRGYTASA